MGIKNRVSNGSPSTDTFNFEVEVEDGKLGWLRLEGECEIVDRGSDNSDDACDIAEITRIDVVEADEVVTARTALEIAKEALEGRRWECSYENGIWDFGKVWVGERAK